MNAQRYADAVVQALADDFALTGDTGTVVRDAVANHAENANTAGGAFEVIVGSVVTATWRLHPHRTRCGRVRLACHKLEPSTADTTRLERLNRALDAIS
ncbi:hypothetical protein [Actinomadura yumaensis]|uniref:Uncharacterized protein n=1 Tax=Actinomadura yumaensis TaxID=111807 RepID=A0ABW2CP86_9ACTN